MRMSIILPIAAALAAVIGLSSPAAATKLNGALKACNKHGGCKVNGDKNGVNIEYNGSEIYCPHGGGDCVCLHCRPPKRTGSLGTVVTPGGVFGGKPVNGQPAPKAPVLGGSTGTNGGGKPAPKNPVLGGSIGTIGGGVVKYNKR